VRIRQEEDATDGRNVEKSDCKNVNKESGRKNRRQRI